MDRTSSLETMAREQLGEARKVWVSDREAKLPGVWLPDALSVNYPKAGGQWPWLWLWPSREVSFDPRSGLRRRHIDGLAAVCRQAIGVNPAEELKSLIGSEAERQALGTELRAALPEPLARKLVRMLELIG
jgi:hypothetical protein